MRKIVIILDNVRSAHNVGSILRTADGIGINQVVMCGITPHPQGAKNDSRLPHIANSADKMIKKTALGAEKTVSWAYEQSTKHAIEKLADAYSILCLEQSATSISIEKAKDTYSGKDIALVVGTEVSGITQDTLRLANDIVEIPMKGKKESLNVSIAAAIAMYELAKA